MLRTRAPFRVLVTAALQLGVIAGGGQAALHAQTTAQIPMQFDFLNPGARTLAMGGAFLGAADDATTAFANPSGLAFLHRREVSAEGRFRRMDTRFLGGGRVSGTVTGRGADTRDGPWYATDVDRHVSPVFLSFVMPAGRATLAGYRHEAARASSSFAYDGAFQRVSFGGFTANDVRDLPLAGTREVTIVNYGGAIGVPLTPTLAVGGGLSVYTFRLRSDFARFNVGSSVFDPVDRSRVTATATQDGSGVALGANIGVLWSPREGFRVGALFRRGPGFAFTQVDDVPLNDLHLERTGRFKVPDVFGVGVEWRVSESLRLLADYDRVQYSQLKGDFIDLQAVATGREAQLRIDDGNEVHAGGEYTVLGSRWPLAFRGGVWFDPDHSVRYVPTAQNDAIDVLMTATLPGGADLVHYAFGAGVALASRVEVNAAADLSARTRYVTVSTVFRF